MALILRFPQVHDKAGKGNEMGQERFDIQT